MTNRIQGIFTPHIVPLDQRGQINEADAKSWIV
jgi:hypothetical protein